MTSDAAAVYVDPGTLTPWEQNPRDNEEAIDKVARSIERFGFASPIIARTADGRVIAGHTRLAAALRLDLKDVPVRFLDLAEQPAGVGRFVSGCLEDNEHRAARRVGVESDDALADRGDSHDAHR